MHTIRIGFVGLGVVGQATWKNLQRRKEILEHRLGVRIELARAAVRDPGKRRGVEIPAALLTDDALAVARDPEIDLVCELMGGTRLAREVTLAALETGKRVVTANKALLCEEGASLFKAAQATGAGLYFEASVAGGIPIVKALREGLVVNQCPLIYGILNGTCNYILSRMEGEGKSFEDIVGDARRLGYVEADESLDLDGIDAAHKAVILAYLAHGYWCNLPDMRVEGIRRVTLEDLRWADELGYRVKLLAAITRDFEQNTVAASVAPTLIPQETMVASVNGVFNAVSVHGDVVGETTFVGRGAGPDPTASAVISDIIDAILDMEQGGRNLAYCPEGANLRLATPEERCQAHYLRLLVVDQPGVLARIATIMADFEISIERMLQFPAGDRGRAGTAHLVLTTHMCSEAAIEAALAKLAYEAKDVVLEDPFRMGIF